MVSVTLIKQFKNRTMALSLALPTIFWNDIELVIDLPTVFNIIFKPIPTINIQLLGFKFIFSLAKVQNVGDTSNDS